MIIEPSDRASSENPRKRVKLEEPDEKPFQDHPTLYIDDGNVILRTGGTLFCRDNERFRGLSHYTMEETREDLEVLLNVIYDGL
ncbi:hypothetical protein C8T65DRAFT_834351 [Cerioporus squamosus]|nr:hypothetical protein C8T65DRAFT_834351 [Cerioporus squamosus]